MPFSIEASANHQLDILLEYLTAELQLTKTQYETATGHYRAVADWLEQPDSELLKFRPEIYPQGSMLLRTTVRPLRRNEFDLDFICSLHMTPDGEHDPASVYDMIADRVAAHQTYADRMERKPRCIRIVYADDFNLDIVPACPDHSRGGTAVLVADRELGRWVPNDPKRYALWFDGAADRIGLELVAAAEPVPAHQPAEEKPPLKRSVQLFKRRRDVLFDGRSFTPASIVLTTLCGHHYAGQALCTDALLDILGEIQQQIMVCGGAAVVPNPVDPSENLTARWQLSDHRAFSDFVSQFLTEMEDLVRTRGLDGIAEKLRRMFDLPGGDGRSVVASAFVEYGREAQEAHDSGEILQTLAPFILSTASQGTRRIPKNTFHGR